MPGGRRDILLKILSDPDSAVRGMRTVKRELRDFDGTEAQARITIKKQAIEEQIRRVQERLAHLSEQEATPQVKLKMARAIEQIDRLELKLDKLDHKDVEVKVDVDRSSLDRIGGIFTMLSRRFGRFGGGAVGRGIGNVLQALLAGAGAVVKGLSQIPSLLSNIGEIAAGAFESVLGGIRGVLSGTTSLGSVLSTAAGGIGAVAAGGAGLALSFAGIAAIGGVLVIVLNALLGAVIALAGALLALVASLALAAAGLGAVGVALAAAFGPALLVGIAFFSRLSAVMEAHKAHEQELTKAVEDQKTAEQQRAAALDASRHAHDQLAQATVDGRRAMAQSAIDLRNAELGLEASRLGVRRSRLELAQARRDLRDLLKQAGTPGASLNALTKKFSDVDFDPSQAGKTLGAAGATHKIDPLELRDKILRVAEAQLGVKQAVERTTEAERNLSQAQKTRLDFARRGLDAYGPYRTAVHAAAQADQRLAAAQHKAAAAQTTYRQKLRQLTGDERGFLGQLEKVIGQLERLAGVIAKPIFAGLERAFGALQKLFADTAIQRGLEAIGTAIGSVIAQLGRQLSTQRWRDAFAGFARDAARMIPQLGRAFGAVLDILRVIAQAAMPELRRIVRDVSGWLQRLAGQPGKIHHAVGLVVEQFRAWLRFAGAVARLVINLFAAAAPAGKSLAGSMTQIVNNWADWIAHNPRKVQEFFREAANKTRQIVKWLADAFVWLKDHLPSAAEKAKGAFGAIWRIARGIYHAVKGTAELLQGDLKKGFEDLGFGAPTTHGVGGQRKRGESVPKAVLRELLHGTLGYQGGGYTGDEGGLVHRREFVLREAITNALGVDRLRALNAGVPPELVFATASGGSRTQIGHQHVGDRHTHFHIDARDRNAGSLMDEMEREITREGG